jgi:hypothetical protein
MDLGFWDVVSMLALTLVVGVIGRVLTPRDAFRHMEGWKSWLVSIGLGLVATVLGYLFFSALLPFGDDDVLDWGGIFGALVFAVPVVLIASAVARKVGGKEQASQPPAPVAPAVPAAPVAPAVPAAPVTPAVPAAGGVAAAGAAVAGAAAVPGADAFGGADAITPQAPAFDAVAEAPVSDAVAEAPAFDATPDVTPVSEPVEPIAADLPDEGFEAPAAPGA